ncbi:TetR family transcriptional regulator C-terminal domain-containing protein [Mycobacterium avium]|uniref:TetR family transcriptional regulator C-terminal domain-containing protein n=1 Tax=Mycobacterium avium TaxID=1764 RepID=UPI003AFB0F51
MLPRSGVSGHAGTAQPFACPLGSMAAELKNDEAYLPALDAAFDRWESALAAGLEKMRERGQLRKSADPHRLAAALLAALQGGMLSARVHNDITPLEDAVDNALLALRHKAAAPRIVKR